MSVRAGIEVLVEERASLVGDRRVALLAHGASVDGRLRYAWDRLVEAGARIVCLLTPEHGLFAEAQDMESVDSGRARIGGREVPVRSLYGTDAASLVPAQRDLGEADVLVVDLVDVGSRYYTFAASAEMAASACLDRGIEVVIADRPNPTGGTMIEGGAPVSAFHRSFVGHFDVPARHGLTLGELVLGHAGERDGLEIVPARGWRREQDAWHTDLPWVVPSPNMPTPETALVYPGGCLLEGTNLSEGRGTTRPFETLGAPFLDGEEVASLVGPARLPGVAIRPLRFRPVFHKHAGRTCGGVFVHVTDRSAFRPLRTYLALVWAARRSAPGEFAWRTDTYEFRSDVPAVDLLWGDATLREAIDGGAGLHDVIEMARSDRRPGSPDPTPLLY